MGVMGDGGTGGLIMMTMKLETVRNRNQMEGPPNWHFKVSNRSCSILPEKAGNSLMNLTVAFCSTIFNLISVQP